MLKLEEDRFIEDFHQQVYEGRKKAWHDQHIKEKKFQVGHLVLLYESNFLKHLGKFRMRCFLPYEIKYVTERGVIQLQNLNGELMYGLINGIQLKLYRDIRTFIHQT